MAISFKKKVSRSTKKVSIFRQNVEKVFNTSLQLNQIERMKTELFLSGFVPSHNEADITMEILKIYAEYKSIFPRIAYNKEDIEKSKEIVKNLPQNISAEKIYYLIHEINPNTQDANIYYWFSRIGSKFTTSGEYSKELVKVVLYAALRRKSTQ